LQQRGLLSSSVGAYNREIAPPAFADYIPA
jgi:hypothetical protein